MSTPVLFVIPPSGRLTGSACHLLDSSIGHFVCRGKQICLSRSLGINMKTPEKSVVQAPSYQHLCSATIEHALISLYGLQLRSHDQSCPVRAPLCEILDVTNTKYVPSDQTNQAGTMTARSIHKPPAAYSIHTSVLKLCSCHPDHC